MEVSKINGQHFTANNQNNYNKTYVGRGIGLGVSIGCIAEKIINKGGYKELLEDARDNLAQKLSKEFRKAKTGTNITLQELKTPDIIKMAHNNLAGSLITITLCSIGAGAIVDAIINSNRKAKNVNWD